MIVGVTNASNYLRNYWSQRFVTRAFDGDGKHLINQFYNIIMYQWTVMILKLLTSTLMNMDYDDIII